MNYCNYCHKPDCCGGCKPARYDCMFDLQIDPYDPSKWLVTMNGMLHKVNAPKLNETDTSLSTNYSTATLNYAAERHTDKITGRQLGELINLDDLRDTTIDDTLDGNCYELIYHKWNNCGDGCKSAANEWRNFNINSEGAKNSHIRYVRGANVNGCPQYLEVPARTNEYWFGMWDTQGFTYVQAVPGTLPKDANGNPIVMSIDPTTKKPILGIVEMPDLECLVNNLINAIKPFEGEGRMIDVQSGGSTPEFYGGLNPSTGEFYIHWSDWWRRALLDVSLLQNDVRQTIGGELYNRVGQGQVNGVLTASSSFNYKTGKMTYTITRIYFDKTTYTRDYSGTLSVEYRHYTWGAFPGTYDLSASHQTLTNEGLSLTNGHLFWGPGQSTTNETININRSFTGTYSITVNPGGGVSNWIDVIRLYNDWGELDDDGLVQVRYKNPMNWTQC